MAMHQPPVDIPPVLQEIFDREDVTVLQADAIHQTWTFRATNRAAAQEVMQLLINAKLRTFSSVWMSERWYFTTFIPLPPYLKQG